MGQSQSQENVLCKSCGLCCNGHLFAWAKLRASEVQAARELGLHVLGSNPKDRGFNQPCPLWMGECTIYSSPQYPHFCRVYKCQLLKKLVDETIPLPEALSVVQQAKELIHELSLLLPDSPNPNFRERLVAHIEQIEGLTERGIKDLNFLSKAKQLLVFYKNQFGVKDLVDNIDEM